MAGTTTTALGIERHADSTALTALQYLGLVVGLAVTSMSMSSGFIWASQGKLALTYVAGFCAWSGYVVAHFAVTGLFVDPRKATDEFEADATGGDPDGDGGLGTALATLLAEMRANPARTVVGVVGIGTLVVGIATFTVYVSAANHLLGNLGGALFLGGYAIAHYAETGLFL
jgi:hypothetical protein